MSAGHTPGPWMVDEDGIVRHGPVMLRNWRHPVKIASAWKEDAWCGAQGDDESRANAHLFAAAPDLLEAGQDVLALITAIAPEYAESTVTANLRAAIAKATAR